MNTNNNLTSHPTSLGVDSLKAPTFTFTDA